MPYKNPEDRKANRKLQERVRQIKYWKALGFSIMDENNGKSDVQCKYCGKLSARKGWHLGTSRHHEHCINYRPPRYWSRRALENSSD